MKLIHNAYYQNNQQYFLELKTLVENYPISYCKMLKNKYKHLLNWINSQLSLLDDSYHISTKCYWILNNLVDFPKCKKCGKPIDKKKIKIFKGYQKFCSTKCANSSSESKLKRIQTYLKNYGVEHPWKLKEIIDERQQICLKKYGFKIPSKSKEVKEKYKQTCLNRYGVDNPSKSKEVKEKRNNTFKQKYSNVHPLKLKEVREKIKQTCLEKYGVDNPSKSKEVKEKYKQTCLKKYGVSNPIQNHEIRLRSQIRYSYNDINFDSTPELAYYIWLKDHKISFEYQPNISFEYEYNGKQHVYMPDFKVEYQLIEIKGNQFLKEDGSWQCPWNHNEDDLYEAKHQCCLKNNVKILYSKDYQQYLDYISEKYGKDYLKQFKRN